MTSERWERLQRLHRDSGGLALEERDAFLARECAGDPELLREARWMLAVSPPSSFIEPPADGGAGRLFGIGLDGVELGDFRLLRELGRGGMGVVYLARAGEDGAEVAVKILPAMQGDARVRERFRREVQAASALRHEAIVPIVGSGEERGLAWYAMPHVGGHDLQRELDLKRRAQRGESPAGELLPPFGTPEYVSRAVACVAELARAVHHAHEHDVVHRDVKPSNVLLDRAGRVFLTDFGLARDGRFDTLTRTGAVQGTLPYMSPEQLDGDGRAIDRRTDVYSLSVLLYEALTLRRPFAGESYDELARAIRSRPAERMQRVNPDVAEALEVICDKGMSKRPGDRYATAAELAADLTRFLDRKAIRARRLPRWKLALRALVHHRAWVLAAGVTAAVALLALAYGEGQARRRRLGEELQALEGLAAIDDWTGVPVGERSRAFALHGRLAREAASLDAGARELIAGLGARIERHQGELRARGEAALQAGLATPAGIELFSDTQLFEGFALLRDAELLFGARDDARAFDPRWFHTPLRVVARRTSGAPLEGDVLVCTIDPVTGALGEPALLGRLPLEGPRLRPGCYRLVVRPDGHASREFTRVVLRGDAQLAVDCVVDPARDVLAGMVLVGPGVLALPGEPGSSLAPYGGIPTEVSAFYLDATAVSVGDYREYSLAHGGYVPELWREFLPPEERDGLWQRLMGGEYDERPMVGVSWEEARAYAEWVGKRLPTALERDFAGRGAEGWLHPHPGAEYAGNVFQPRRPPAALVPRVLEYFESTVSVHAPPEELSVPYGLHHMLGNVFEFTETLAVDLDRGAYVPRPLRRVLLGAPWYAAEERMTLATRKEVGTGASYAGPNIGFRCARSIETP